MNLKRNKKVLIDVGSSSIKVYIKEEQELKLAEVKTINLKEGFDPVDGLSSNSKKKLIDFIKSIQKKYPKSLIKIYATALYRKLEPSARKSFVDQFFQSTGLYFNIISHDLENFYLETALLEKCDLKEPILLINIGGGSTELVVAKEKQALKRVNINIGVGTILAEFKEINDSISQISLDKIVDFVDKFLPKDVGESAVAFYTGGELSYMQLAGYELESNYLFADKNHPQIISFKNFARKNLEIYNKITLQELEDLMPANPTWMHGARACSGLAQAVCAKYKVKTIIPSDANLIDGVARREFRSVVISGSFRKHLEYIKTIKKQMESEGIAVLSPRFTKATNSQEESVLFEGEEGRSPLEQERLHLKAIEKADALIVANPGGYVGASAMLEIGYAYELGKRIIFVEEPEEFIFNTLPAEVGI